MQYLFDWGDGTDSGWLAVDQSSASKAWISPGTYSIKAKARSAVDFLSVSDWSPGLSVDVSIPETVSAPGVLSGPTIGGAGELCSYTTGGSASTLGGDVQYFFDWGNGSNSGWLPAGVSSASKTWTARGIYLVRTQARSLDHHSIVSLWSSPLAVTIADGRLVPTPSPETSPA